MDQEGTAPTKAQLRTLIEALSPPDYEIDDVTAQVVLEQAGFDVSALSFEFVEYLEREIVSMSNRGESVPDALRNLVASLQRQPTSVTFEDADPDTWVRALLDKRVPLSSSLMSQPAFRSLNTDL